MYYLFMFDDVVSRHHTNAPLQGGVIVYTLQLRRRALLTARAGGTRNDTVASLPRDRVGLHCLMSSMANLLRNEYFHGGLVYEYLELSQYRLHRAAQT